MKFTDLLTNLYYILAIISIVTVVIKLFYGWFRGDQIGKKFISDVAGEHLPYIYRELRSLNRNAPEHPHISFSHFKDK